MHGSPDSGEIAIIWHRDAKLEPLTLSAADAQFLELLDFNQNQVAKWYRVPPHMMADLKDSKYATVEALGLEFVTYSLFPWCKRWEEQCNLKLFNKDERRRYYVQHDFNGLLRGDFMARMTAYRTAIMDGVMNINECRRLENMNSIGPNGDKYFFPANMMTVDDIVAGKGGQSGQPGSDHTGSANDGMPGALPMPQGGDSAAVFHEWTKHLLKSDREELYSRLDRIEQSLKADARAAALPVSTPDDGRAKKKLAKQKAAIETVFRDAFARLLTKESKAADRAAANKTLDFAGWLDEFYADHEATAIEALRPACAMAAAIGVRAKPKKLARRLCAESRRLLTDGYNTLTRAKLSAMLAEWPTARAVAAAKFACGGPGSGKPGPCSEGGEGPKEPDESQDQHIVKAYESLDSDSQTIDTQVNEMADRADGENAEEIRKEAESYLSEMADDAESYIDDATNEIVDDIGENYDPGDDDKWQETFDSAEQEFRDAMEKTKDGLRSEYESVGGTVGDYADAVASGDDEKKNEFDKAIKDTQSKLDSAAEKVLDEMTQATVIMLARVQGLKPTTKQSLRTKLSCGGKGGRPGPCPGQKQKKPTKEKNKNKETKNEETKTKINVSNKGDEKSNQEVQKIVDDLPESHRSFLDANGVSVQTSSRIDHEGTHPQGTYDPESKTVTVSDDAKGQLTRAEVTRHEIGHAIDMARPIGERLSEDKEFKKAFMKDWKNREKTKNMDTAYFFSHPREAFAQGYSYLTGDMSYTGHEKAFPNTIKWMRKNLPKRGIEL
jgi:hypothetical protein